MAKREDSRESSSAGQIPAGELAQDHLMADNVLALEERSRSDYPAENDRSKRMCRRGPSRQPAVRRRGTGPELLFRSSQSGQPPGAFPGEKGFSPIRTKGRLLLDPGHLRGAVPESASSMFDVVLICICMLVLMHNVELTPLDGRRHARTGEFSFTARVAACQDRRSGLYYWFEAYARSAQRETHPIIALLPPRRRARSSPARPSQPAPGGRFRPGGAHARSSRAGRRPRRSAAFRRETLFEYIDGAAEAYIGYDFRELAGRRVRPDRNENDGHGRNLRHGHGLNAFGIYAAERYPESRFLPIGVQGYYEEGTLNFLAGRYYVKLLCFRGRGQGRGDPDPLRPRDRRRRQGRRRASRPVSPPSRPRAGSPTARGSSSTASWA